MANVDEMFKGVQDTISVKRVYGEPVETDGATVVPAAAVRGGAGGGGDSDHNGGGGFGVHARPVGVWVIRGDEVEWKAALDLNRVAFYAFVLGVLLAIKR